MHASSGQNYILLVAEILHELPHVKLVFAERLPKVVLIFAVDVL